MSDVKPYFRVRSKEDFILAIQYIALLKLKCSVLLRTGINKQDIYIDRIGPCGNVWIKSKKNSKVHHECHLSEIERIDCPDIDQLYDTNLCMLFLKVDYV